MKKTAIAILILVALLAALCACEPADVPDLPSGGGQEEQTANLYFYSDGILYGIAVCSGDTLAMPEEPTKNGFAFVGWFYDEELTTAFSVEEYIARENKTDVSLYAAWNPIVLPPEQGDDDEDEDEGGQDTPEEPVVATYTVTFVLDGEIVSRQTVEEGKSATLPYAQYKAEGNELFSLAADGNYTKVTQNETVTLSWEPADEEDKGIFALQYLTLLIKNGKFYVSDVAGSYPLDYLVLPSSWGIFSISGIKEGAFARIPHVVSVTLGDGYTEVEWGAFRDLILLGELEIDGDNPAYASDGLFVTDVSGDRLLAYVGQGGEELVLPAAKTIAQGALAGADCEKIVVSEGTTTIEARAFADCVRLREATLPTTLSTIGESAFENCTALESICLPENVTKLGNRAFAGCGALTTVYYDATEVQAPVEGNGIFDGAGEQNGLSLVVGQKVKTIPARMFDGEGEGGVYLTEVVFAEGGVLASIGVHAFRGTALTTLNLPSSLKVLSSGAFENCALLTSVYYDCANAVSQGISGTAFGGAGADGSVFTVGKDVSAVPDYMLYSLGGKVNFSALVFEGENLGSIGKLAFAGTLVSGSVTLPSSVAFVGEGAFAQCEGLSEILSDGGAYVSNGGVLYSADGALVAYPAGKTDVGYVVEDGTVEIGGYAFAGATRLEKVEFSCARVGDMAFYDCDVLKEVVFGEGVEEIGTGAFGYCDALSSVTLASTTKVVGENAFMHCGALAEVTLNEGLETLGSYSFAYCPLLGEVALPSSLVNVGNGVFVK